MLDSRIKTYINVVKLGSFTQAAKKEYRSSVAIMKQITSLETELGIKLLNRSNQGVKPTEAGKYLFVHAQQMQEEADGVITYIKRMSQKEIIHIGTSLLRPSDSLVKLWLVENNRSFVLQLVPFVDTFVGSQSNILTNDMDCIVTPFSVSDWDKKYNYLPLGEYDCQIGVPLNNKLAHKKYLTWDDLNNQSLLLLKKGKSTVIDKLRHEITTEHPEVTIFDLDHLYDISSFNQAINEGSLIEVPSIWNSVYPEIKVLPMEWEYKIPYGLLYRKNASIAVREFVKSLAQMTKQS